MEPLATNIWSFQALQGLISETLHDLVSLYADNTLLYLQHAETSLLEALHILDDYSLYSGLKINWDKSCVSLLDPTLISKQIFLLPLKWVMQFSYLGIQVSRSVMDVYILNIPPLLQFIHANFSFQRWPVLV